VILFSSIDMSEETKTIKFLVVSASPYMRGIIKFVVETLLMADVEELESEEKALLFLKNVNSYPCMIIYDYTSNAYLLEDFVGYLKEHAKHLRIVVLVDEVRQEGRDLLKVVPQLKLMDEASLPNELIKEAQKAFVDAPYRNESEYCRIAIDFLAILDGINKNLYIKLGADKFFKIFNADDDTSNLDIKKYKDKGIEYLYVNRETALWVITQIQKQINVFLKANNFRFILRGASETPEKRFEQKILRIDEEVHIEEEFKQTIDRAIENIRLIVEKEQRIDHLVAMMKQNKKAYAFFTQKINLTSVIACVLAKELDWISKTTINKLLYASVVSDITLAVRPELLKISTLSQFDQIKATLSDEDQKLFLSHPKDASHLIKRYFSSAPPDTDDLVFQHHELPDGSGFPLGVKAEKISPLAALFIIANEFSYYFLTDEEPSMDEFLLKCNGRFDFVNFRKVVKALEKIRLKR
jgi:HD-GYP domain-containing protein (c-di-GMP phosphodiesterase class II)